MKFSSFAKRAIALAVVSASAVGAQAATTDLGVLTAGELTTFTGSAKGPFLDLFTFILPANSGTSYAVENAPFTFFGQTFNTVFTNFALVSNMDGIIGSGDDFVVTSVTLAGTNTASLSTAALTSGSYFLSVSGLTNGTGGGFYGGAIEVTPVPEPESYAMLLAGLGVMGAIAVRRNKAKKQD